MNVRRYLFALPVAFAATLAAAACSSSSSSTVVNGDAGGLSAECQALNVCCGLITTASLKGQCLAAVAAQSDCSGNLSTLTTGGDCTPGGMSAGSSATTTASSSASTGPGSSGSSAGSSGGSSGGTGDSGGGGAGTCASPGAVPVGFVPPTGIVGTGCTSTQVTQLGTDEVTDGGGNYSTVVAGGAPDGSLNSCGECVQGTELIPGMAFPTTWSAIVAIVPYATVGDTSSFFAAFNDGPNFGGCILAADPVAGKQCGLDLMAVTACEFAVCLPVCAVTGGAENPDFTALSGCLSTADTTSCASYVAKIKTDCAPLSNDASTGIFDKCAKLSNIDSGDTEAGVATAQTQTDFFGLLCGGADAGI